MGALVTIHNDGPDDVEVVYGRQRVLLGPGGSLRLSTSVALEFAAVPKLSPEELAMHMGHAPGTSSSGARPNGRGAGAVAYED